MPHLRKLLLIAGCVLAPFFAGAAPAEQPDRTPPLITAMVANFYYQDLPAAKKWYTVDMGFPVVYDDGWVVIVDVGPGMQIALVDANRGALKAVTDKGAMLALETDVLEQWYDYVREIKGIQWSPYNGEDPRHFKHGIREHGDYEEFRVLDPGGYIIEFYRWKANHFHQGAA